MALFASRLFGRAGTALLAGSCMLLGIGAAGAADKPPIKIGVDVELTGVYASSGVYVLKTVEAYAKMANEKGGIDGHKIELVVIDNQSKPDLAIAAFRKLANDDQVHFVICCGNSAISLAVKPLTQQLMVPTVASGQALEVISPPEKSQWIFRPNLPQDTTLRIQLDALKKAGAKSVAILAVNYAYGTYAAKLLTQFAPEFGLTVTGAQFFEAAATDVKAQLTLLNASKPDAILVWAIGPQATLAAKNAQELSMKTKLYQSMGAANAEFVRDGGSAVEGNYVSASVAMVPFSELPKSDPAYQVLKEYNEAWMKTHNMTGDEFGRTDWDGMNLLAIAVKEKKPDLTKLEEARKAIRDGIEGVKNYRGLTGLFNMSPEDHSGLGNGGGALLLIKDGKFTLVQ